MHCSDWKSWHVKVGLPLAWSSRIEHEHSVVLLKGRNTRWIGANWTMKGWIDLSSGSFGSNKPKTTSWFSLLPETRRIDGVWIGIWPISVFKSSWSPLLDQRIEIFWGRIYSGRIISNWLRTVGFRIFAEEGSLRWTGRMNASCNIACILSADRKPSSGGSLNAIKGPKSR